MFNLSSSRRSHGLADETDVLGLLAGGEIEILDSYDAAKGTPAAVTDVGEVYMPLEGLIDVEAEKTRLGQGDRQGRDRGEKM